MPTLGRYTFSRNAYFLVQQALSRLGHEDTSFLGSASYDADAVAAEIISRCERRIHDRVTALSEQEGEVTVAAGSRDLVLPEDLDGMNILQVKVTTSSSWVRQEPMVIEPRFVGENRSQWELTTAQTSTPRWLYPTGDFRTLRLDFLLSQELTFNVRYRVAPTQYTSDDLGSSSTKYSSIPDQYADSLYLAVAAEFADVSNLDDKMAKMLAMQSVAEASLVLGLSQAPGMNINVSYDRADLILDERGYAVNSLAQPFNGSPYR